MKLVILLLALAAVEVVQSKDGSIRALFKEKVAYYREKGVIGEWNKGEEKERFKLFTAVVEFLEALNEKIEGWTTALNKFSLMTEEERKSYLGLNVSDTDSTLEKREYGFPFDVEIEKRVASLIVDWSLYLVEAKDQKQCGSCWTFGAAGALEFQINKYRADNIALSEQNFLDCTYERNEPGRDGCNGGDPSQAWDWMKSNGNRIAYMKDYPYQQRDGSCRSSSGYANAMSGYKLAGYKYVGYGVPNDAGTRDALASRVLAGFIQVQGGFNYYESGVYYEGNCDGINHAIVIVGYGNENGQDYFNVRNSWGADWGEAGHIKMLRGYNTCNVAAYGQWPEISSDYKQKKE